MAIILALILTAYKSSLMFRNSQAGRKACSGSLGLILFLIAWIHPDVVIQRTLRLLSISEINILTRVRYDVANHFQAFADQMRSTRYITLG